MLTDGLMDGRTDARLIAISLEPFGRWIKMKRGRQKKMWEDLLEKGQIRILTAQLETGQGGKILFLDYLVRL